MPITPDPGVLYGYKNPEDSTLDSDGYVGVDPIYQNFANKTDKPLGETDPEEIEVTEPETVEVTPVGTLPNSKGAFSTTAEVPVTTTVETPDETAGEESKDEAPKTPAKPSTK